MPSVYFGNIMYYQLMHRANTVTIEKYENFEKQTYRNRCEIYGANGKLNLIVPVSKNKDGRKTIAEARINNHDNWQKIHWRSLESAYRTSPYFEYYENQLKELYQVQFDLLFELNQHIHQTVLNMLKLEINHTFSSSYEKYPLEKQDYRSVFDPKIITLEKPEVKEYTQVFSNKHGFIPNLSIVDLLCNCGPESINYL